MKPLLFCLRILGKIPLCSLILFSLIPAAFSQDKVERGSALSDKKLQEMVDETRLRDTILHLQGMGNRSSWEKQWEAARWLIGEFEREGLRTALHEYEFRGQRWPNVIAEIPGSGIKQEVVILIAHLDSIAYDSTDLAPGADDNASGVAVILEVARAFKNLKPERVLRFCVFSNEERGQAGSKAYVGSLKENERIKAVINLDVLGYSRPSNPLQIRAISSQGNFRGMARAIYRAGRNLYYGVSWPKQALVVAGRPANAGLAAQVQSSLAKGGDLGVKTLIGKDCG
jgi:Zn-dependent M28 family amino/carboxypeptidase